MQRLGHGLDALMRERGCGRVLHRWRHETVAEAVIRPWWCSERTLRVSTRPAAVTAATRVLNMPAPTAVSTMSIDGASIGGVTGVVANPWTTEVWLARPRRTIIERALPHKHAEVKSVRRMGQGVRMWRDAMCTFSQKAGGDGKKIQVNG